MKKVFAMLLCLSLIFALVACGENVDPSVSDSSSSFEASVSSDGTSDSTEDPVPNWVLAEDQIKNRAVIYDLDAYEEGDTLEDLEIWSVNTGHAAGLKYREDTVFGDVVIVCGDKTAIYEYPSKREIWSTTNSGGNSHSVEILPSGNILIANSTENTVRFFPVSALLEGNVSATHNFKDYTFKDAHGVLWDPEYEVLWVLGGSELAAYSVFGEGTQETLKKISGMGIGISELGSGHDLQPDYSDTRYLYFTAGQVYRFDKETNKASAISHASDFYVKTTVKGFSENENGAFFSTGELGGDGKFFEGHTKESWLTDTILFYTKTERRGKIVVEKKAFTATESAFYKVRSFCGRYQ